MQIKRNGEQPSQKGPDDWFTGRVRIDPLHTAPARVGAALANNPQQSWGFEGEPP
jgi:hypothetical protein